MGHPILTLEEAESLFYEMMDETDADRMPPGSYSPVELHNLMLARNQQDIERKETRIKYARKRIKALYGEEIETKKLKLYVTRGDWAVTNIGILCLKHYYVIERDRVYGGNWLEHMAEKGWVNMFDFLRCLLYARVKYQRKQELLSSDGQG